MSAMAARQSAVRLSTRGLPFQQPRRYFVSPSANNFSTRSNKFTIGSPSTPRPLSLHSSMYSISSLGLGQSTRSISLWPGSKKEKLQPSTIEPSPDTLASDADHLPNVKSTSASDISSSTSIDSSETVSHIQANMSDATEKVQTLADLGQLSSWPNVRAAQEVLDWMVEATGLPWWATIALVTISVRVIILPVVFKGQANAIRLGNINPKMQRMMKDIQYAKSVGDMRLLQESATAVQKLMKDNNCSPLKSFIAPAIQMPVFISFFFALRGLAGAQLTSMQSGGLSWFSDLTVADPYVILPVISAAMTLAVLETGAEMGGAAASGGAAGKTMRNVLRGITVLSIPFLMNFPAAVFCFWATNNTFSLLQLVVLQQPSVRKALKLPERVKPSEEDLPKGKAMGFWDSVSAGKTSQQNVSAKIQRDHVPSVLQQQRHLEDGREAALQRIMEGQAPSSDTPPSISNNVTPQVDLDSQEANSGPLLSRQAREEEKNRRVQMNRRKRASRKQSP